MLPTRYLIPGLLFAVLTAAPGAAQEYYADIRPLLVDRCMGCHTDDGVAWSMEDADETYAKRGKIARMVESREMPPWLAEAGHQAYRDDLSLEAGTVAMVDRWARGGFHRGDPRPDPEPTRVHHPFHGDLSVDVLGGSAYLPNQDRPDDYRCFVADWTGTEEGFVTGFRAVPGNLRVAHHVVVYAIAPDMVERFRELDAEEEGAGYRCFGGALPDRLGERSEREAYEARYPDGVRELDRANFWLAHWAPGMDGHRFPEGTGIPMKPGSALVVQMHYYSAEAPGESDAGTRLDFQVAPSVDRRAFHLAQTRNRWLSGQRNGSMVVEPGQTATYRLSDNLADLLGYVGFVTDVDPDRIAGLEIHSANLHMHAIGHSGSVSLVDGNGRTETLLRIPRWDLAWQRDFAFVEPFVFTREEVERASLAVECTFHNPRDETVYGGFGSDDEMCFNFSYVAVREGERSAEPPQGH